MHPDKTLALNSSEYKSSQSLLYVTLHDFKSYEVVDFGKLDSSFTEVEDDSLYKLYRDLMDEQLENAKKANSRIETYAGLSYYTHVVKRYINESKIAIDSGLLMIEKMKDRRAAFKPEFNGWKMNHSYRSKNLSGNTAINHYTYYLDRDLKKLVNHEDIGTADEHD